MGKRSIVCLCVLTLFGVACLSCGAPEQDGGAPSSEPGRGAAVNVFASIAPVADIMERIGGGHVSVSVLVKAGQDHHTFEPTAKQMAAVTAAPLYFEVGTLPFESPLVARLTRSHRTRR